MAAMSERYLAVLRPEEALDRLEQRVQRLQRQLDSAFMEPSRIQGDLTDVLQQFRTLHGRNRDESRLLTAQLQDYERERCVYMHLLSIADI